mgnify:FL=1
MRRFLSICLLAVFACVYASVYAKVHTVADIPMVHLQDRTRYVSNPDSVLGAQAVAVMDTTLYNLEQETGIQVLVVAVENIEGGDCFDFAYKLGEENGVGQKKKDNGLVILLVTGERCVQFATGYGLEGDLPDAICKRIQVRYMNSYFRDGKWDEGMVAGVRAVRAQLTGTGEPLTGDDDEEGMGVLWVMGVLMLSWLGLSWHMARKKSLCPNCKKHGLRRVSSQVLSRKNGVITEEVIYKCRKCGHTVTRQEKRDNNSNNSRHGGGTFIGGFGGGGGYSSSGGGGSFGGGSFGGGGAGSKF